MPDYKQVLLPEPMRSIDSAAFDGTYMPFLNSIMVASPLTFPSRMLLIVNNSGVLVTISWDGANDALVMLPGAGFAFDQTANAVSNAVLSSRAGTQFYAKGAASIGLVYLSTFYAA